MPAADTARVEEIQMLPIVPPRTPMLLLLALIAACDAEDLPGMCFPLPTADVLRSASPRPGEQDQGTSLQGGRAGQETQGRDLQGDTTPTKAPRTGQENQGSHLGLGDLNGARFAVAGTGAAVTLRDGQLVADAAAGSAAVVDGELAVRTRDGVDLSVEVTRLDSPGGGDRFAILVADAPVCAAGEDGVFVPGHWDETGAHSIDGDELTYACMDGVIAKCVDWGYAPWVVGAEVHQSCTRLARADYCGVGEPWTLDGTTIDAYDGLGVQARVGDPTFEFEAAWGVDGAICVNETRYVVEDDDGRTIRPDCFAELPKCASLEAASRLGAVLANDSAHTAITACE